MIIAAATVAATGGSAAALPAERVVTYDVREAGNPTGDLGTFAAVARETLNDPRGWSMVGRVAFEPVASGGQFTLWLARPPQLEAFSSACSTEWSCRVGNDVIINGERWATGATEWPGSLADYRSYVINHEVGHWLGLGHVPCPAVGQPAPVMMQASKGLDGCTPRVWPLDRELLAVANRLGITLSGHRPIGDVNASVIADNVVAMAGWAIDPDQVGPIQVALTADGHRIAEATADGDRPDVAAVHPLYGAAHGYSITAPVPLDTTQLCVLALDATGDGAVELGCRRAQEQPIGRLDRAWVVPGGVAAYGWAIDPDAGTAPTEVHLYADGRFAASVTAAHARPDVQAAYPGFGPNHGWQAIVPERAEQLCAWALDDQGRPPENLGCADLDHLPFGALDAVADGPDRTAFYGWAIDPDTEAPVSVHVYDGDTFVGAFPASQDRPDVAAAHPAYGSEHGYAEVIARRTGRLCAYAIDDLSGYRLLGCRS